MYSTALSTVDARWISIQTRIQMKWLFPRELTAVDGVGILIGDLDAELLLYRHNNLNGVQAVQAKVVCEVSSGLDLYQMLLVFVLCTTTASFP
jgi:hypothetical protein